MDARRDELVDAAWSFVHHDGNGDVKAVQKAVRRLRRAVRTYGRPVKPSLLLDLLKEKIDAR